MYSVVNCVSRSDALVIQIGQNELATLTSAVWAFMFLLFVFLSPFLNLQSSWQTTNFIIYKV